MTQPASEELLVQAANSARAEQRSGKALRKQVPFIAVFSAVGWWLVFGVRLSPVLKYVAVAVGMAAFVIAALFASGAVILNPIAPWGKAVRGLCPRCGQPRLREDKVMHFKAPGSGKPTVRGVVTLCTADCGHAGARDITVSPDGGLR
jgi:hypothetical protein